MPALLASSLAMGAELNITAEFTPNPLNPASNKFVNTTPNGGFCSSNPGVCASRGLHSILTPITTIPTPIVANHDDPRQGAMIKIPGAWRDVLVAGRKGSETHTLRFRMAGHGGAYELKDAGAVEITGVADVYSAHSALWGSLWQSPPSPCEYSGHPIAGFNTRYAYFWITPVSDSVCAKKSLFDIPSFNYDKFNFAYEIETPNPLDMSAGSYRGSLNFSVGAGGDIDFGDLATPYDPILTLNFDLVVTHILTVKFPTGSDRLALIPQGGWQQWLQRGRRPEKLFAKQDFQLWSSTKFAMRLECQYAAGDDGCGIQNGGGDTVPVITKVTLPPGFSSSGSPQQLRMSTDQIFQPAMYVDNGRATLHFEVGKDSVEQMTSHSGTQYSGNVTVVWDGDI